MTQPQREPFTVTVMVPASIVDVMRTEAAIDGMEAPDFSAAGVQQFVAGYLYAALRGLSPVTAAQFRRLNKPAAGEEP